MSQPTAEGLTEIRARIAEREDEWAWHEQTDDMLAGHGYHMSQMLYRLPRDGQTRDMKASIESMLADLKLLADRLAAVKAERDEMSGWIEEHALVKTLARISDWQEATGAELPAMARAAMRAYAARAESAEAERDALRERIEALADDIWRESNQGPVLDLVTAIRAAVDGTQ